MRRLCSQNRVENTTYFNPIVGDLLQIAMIIFYVLCHRHVKGWNSDCWCSKLSGEHTLLEPNCWRSMVPFCLFSWLLWMMLTVLKTKDAPKLIKDLIWFYQVIESALQSLCWENWQLNVTPNRQLEGWVAFEVPTKLFCKMLHKKGFLHSKTQPALINLILTQEDHQIVFWYRRIGTGILNYYLFWH
jgi:hypothetical protein